MAWQDPKTTWKAADVVLPSDLNRIEGNVQHVKSILDDATPSATANRLVIRDSGGRASFGSPTSPSHAATKEYVDARASVMAMPSDTPLAEWSGTWRLTGTQSVHIYVPVGGRYRIQIQAAADEHRSEYISDGGGYVTVGGDVRIVSPVGHEISARVRITSATMEWYTLDMTFPAIGWMSVVLDPDIMEIPHWEDPSEFGYETITGSVSVSYVILIATLYYAPIGVLSSEVYISQ